MSLTARRSSKHLGHLLRTNPSAHIVDTRWSALARTDVVALGPLGKQRHIVFTDGDAASRVVSLPITPASWAELDRDVGLFPYRTPPRQRVLILSTGGGLDVLLALRGGAQAISAVEVDPDVLRAVERVMSPTRNVYRAPNVQVVRSEGRHFVRQTAQRYDLIVLPLVYTGAAQRRSAALAENYVLTTEAFADYLAHLTPQGRLVVQVHDAVELWKTVFMSLQAMQQRGRTTAEALHHLMLLQQAPGTLDTPWTVNYPLLILKNHPYTPVESHQHARLAQAMRITPLFIPHLVTVGPFEALTHQTSDLSAWLTALPTGWRPATDDCPFFYEMAAYLAAIPWLLLGTLGLLFGLHLWHYHRQRTVAPVTPGSTAWLPFFAGTGCAALLVQVALLQQYVLVLGSPTLTLVVLLLPLLCCGGLGSLASTMLSDRALRWVLPWSCLVLSVFLLLSQALVPGLFALLEQQKLLTRPLSSIGLLAPLGCVMGLPFPAALRILSQTSNAVTPWAWGVNAIACVLGSVSAVGMAMAWGLQAVVLVGALVYMLAGGWARCLLVYKA